jgi:hypothetical protein
MFKGVYLRMDQKKLKLTLSWSSPGEAEFDKFKGVLASASGPLSASGQATAFLYCVMS